MLTQVVSGGQTGVDRAALDVAVEFGIPCGGWCPAGRKAEDGPIPPRYPLQETGTDDYAVRTQKNVRDSDGTLILNSGSLASGTAVTFKSAAAQNKPCLVVDLDRDVDPGAIADWVKANGISILNVAGPRESKVPGIYERAAAVLRGVLAAPPGIAPSNYVEKEGDIL